jgi:hypothetical protein
MWIEAVTGREHTNERRYPRPRNNPRLVKNAPIPEQSQSEQPAMYPTHGDSDTRVVLDEDHHVLKVEFVNPKTGAIVNSISARDFQTDDHHGLLIDVAT